jgi:hypothetical protein
MQDSAKDWHESGLALFDLPSLDDSVESWGIRNIYHNYEIWHFLEEYESPDANRVAYVYEGGNLHNKLRNQSVEELDQRLCSRQKGTGKINSETLGSVLDRLGIFWIKMLHLRDLDDQRHLSFKKQLAVLTQCAHELMDDMISGERQCFPTSRFKLYEESLSLQQLAQRGRSDQPMSDPEAS